MSRITAFVTMVVLLATIFAANSAHAVPILQLYLEGGTYNETTETWELTAEGSSAGEPFRLWAIGNVKGPGGKGPISDVRLSVAYDESYKDLIDISFTPSTTGGYGGFDDGSMPAAPHQNGVPSGTVLRTTSTGSSGWLAADGIVTDGSQPVLGSGKALPAHGIYGEGTVWREYALGDFTLEDSPVGDFIGAFPDEIRADSGQINVYEVSITGGHGATVHFDLYDSVASGTKAKFAPFSHDGDGTDGDASKNVVPEPTTLAIWSVLGLIGLAAFRRKQGR